MTLWVGFAHPKLPRDQVWGGYRSCESGDMFFLLSRDQDIEVSRDFVDVVPSSCVTTLLSLGSTDLMEVEIMAFIISVPIPIPIPMPRFTIGPT